GADGAQGGAGRGHRAPARAREARGDALLLRGADPARDRRGARRHRVARLAAAHEGDLALEGAPRRVGGTRAARPLARAAFCAWLTLDNLSDDTSPAGGPQKGCGRVKHRRFIILAVIAGVAALAVFLSVAAASSDKPARIAKATAIAPPKVPNAKAIRKKNGGRREKRDKQA